MDIRKASILAVDNVLKEGLTDIFQRPKELELIRNPDFAKLLVEKVVKCLQGNSLDSLDISPIDHVLIPKGRPFDFRRCALIQPLDTIKYLALVLTLADEIEKHRPSTRKKVVFSYRFSPKNGLIFDQRYNITKFKETTARRSRSKDTNVLVSCDIANFYDRLNLHRLESLLLSFGLDKTRVGQLNELLLFWANRDSYGLPVGSNASRILAEAALIEVDNYMLSIGAKFSRFVDDYRLFAPDAQRAHYWLTQLIERLWLEGLTINKMKTLIDDVSNLHTQESTNKDEINNEADLDLDAPTIKPIEKDKKTHRQQFRIIAGYGGIIPTRFREPSQAELNKFSSTDPDKLLHEIKEKRLLSPENIMDFVKSVISTKRYSLFVELPDIANMYLQFTMLIVDVLCKYADNIPDQDRLIIRDKFIRELERKNPMPEYFTMAVVRLLGEKSYVSKETLFRFFRNLRRNAGAYIGRGVLDALEPHVTRAEVLEIRSYFARADPWEKRAIVRIVGEHLHEDEKRPWLKNVKTQESRDIFLVEEIQPTKKKQA